MSMCASRSRISLKNSLVNTTSLDKPEMYGSISELSNGSTACHGLENWRMVFSANASTNPVIMNRPQLPGYGATNGAQLFLVSLSTTLVLKTWVNAMPTIFNNPFRNITSSPQIERGEILWGLTLTVHILSSTLITSTICPRKVKLGEFSEIRTYQTSAPPTQSAQIPRD